MDLEATIKAAFLPEFYDKEIATSDNSLCLIRRNGFGRYCLYCTELKPDLNIQLQVDAARKRVQKLSKAFYIFAEVGVYIVFTCKDSPSISSSSLKVDLSGFHAVIVQGIHIMPLNGKHIYNHSKWFTKTFGDAEYIAPKLIDITSEL